MADFHIISDYSRVKLKWRAPPPPPSGSVSRIRCSSAGGLRPSVFNELIVGGREYVAHKAVSKTKISEAIVPVILMRNCYWSAHCIFIADEKCYPPWLAQWRPRQYSVLFGRVVRTRSVKHILGFGATEVLPTRILVLNSLWADGLEGGGWRDWMDVLLDGWTRQTDEFIRRSPIGLTATLGGVLLFLLLILKFCVVRKLQLVDCCLQ